MPFQIKVERDADIEALSRADLRTAMDERSLVLHNIFVQAGENLDHSKVTEVEVKDGAALATQIRTRNAELSKLGERQDVFNEADSARAANERIRNTPAGADPKTWSPRTDAPAQKPVKSFGELFVASDVYQAAKNKQPNIAAELDVDPGMFMRGMNPQNAVFLTTAGWTPETLRSGRLLLDEQREVEVTDALPLFPTNQSAIVFMEETTFTNAAAERAENTAYPESALVLTEQSVTVRSVGTSLPVTDEQLADVDGVRAYLDQRLGFMVRQRLDSQILVGNGTAPNLRGTLNVAGINTQAKGGDPTPDAVYKAMTLVRVNGRAQPNVAIFHPNDWQEIRLLRTADGIYIWGSPSEAAPARIWGLPVIETTGLTENTGIVGDYARFAGLYMRQGLEVLTGFVNDDFKLGRVTIRAGIRAAVAHFRPLAFSQITGI